MRGVLVGIAIGACAVALGMVSLVMHSGPELSVDVAAPEVVQAGEVFRVTPASCRCPVNNEVVKGVSINTDGFRL